MSYLVDIFGRKFCEEFVINENYFAYFQQFWDSESMYCY